jgi:uncharacterized protein YraI
MQNSPSNQSYSQPNNSSFSPLFKAFKLLSEAQKQRTVRKEALEFVLHKWKGSKEKEIPIISRRIRLWLFLSDWGWLIGIFLFLIGFTAINQINALNRQSKLTPNCSLDNDCITLIKAATVNDADSPDFAEGNLTVRLKEGGTPDDKIFIYNQGNNEGGIRTEDNKVLYEDRVIGNFQGGIGTDPLLITFNQDATPTAVEALLSKITYQNLSINKGVGSRKIEVLITDGDGGINKGTSKPLFKTVVVINDDNPPNITLPNSLSVKENNSLLIGKISISKSNSQNATVTLGVDNGTLTVKNNVAQGLKVNGISGNMTNKVILKGKLSEINATLADPSAIIYRSTKDFSGNDSLKISVNGVGKTIPQKTDLVYPPNAVNAKTASNNISIAVNPANAPSIVKIPTAQNVNEDTNLNIGGIEIKDPDTQSLTVTLDATNGTLIVNNKVLKGLQATNIRGNKSKEVILKGNIAQINTTLANVAAIAYQGIKDFNGNDLLSITVDDGKHKQTQTISITVNPINDPPVIEIIKATKPTPISSPPPDSSNAQPPYPIVSPSINTTSVNTNAIVSGKPGTKNLRSGYGLEYRVVGNVNTGDRVRVVDSASNSDNFLWYKIYVPQSGLQGWIASNLLSVDGQPQSQSPIQTQPPRQTQSPVSSNGTNATVGGAQGTKNIRSGAGTIYGIVGKVRTGDRIQILGTSYDREGYQWYNIYDPQSGARGWIAAQLVSRD